MLWRHMGGRRYSSTILGLRTRWRCVVGFTPLPLYPAVKNPRCPFDMRVDGSQSQSGRCEEKKLSCWESNPRPLARSPSLYRQSYPDSLILKFFNWYSRGWSPVGSTGHCLLVGLLCQPRVIMMMKLVEWRLAGETEVLGENLPQCRFVHHKPHMPTWTRTRAVAVGSWL
jgi:hypothetical protein